MAITRQQIFDTADQLVNDGKNPTLSNVRAALGSGSFSTISEAMTEWKAKQQEANQPIREAAPEAITQRLSELGNEVWSVAQEIANARLKSEREALEQSRAELEAGKQEAVDLADQLSVELEALQTRHNKAVEDIRQANELLSQKQETNQSLARQLESADIRIEENQGRMEDLKTELKHAHEESRTQRAQLAEAQKDARSQREQLAQAQQLSSDSRESAARLSGELEELHSQHKQMTKDKQQADQIFAKKQEDNVELAKQLESSSARIEANKARLEDLKAELKQAHEETHAQRKQLTDTQQVASDSREAAARLAGELEALKAQNAQLLKTGK